MNKIIMALAVIAIVALVVAVISLGVAFTVLFESHPSTSTPAPTSTEPTPAQTATLQSTPTPTATPNLSSAIQGTKEFDVEVTATNTYMGALYDTTTANITNISSSTITLAAIYWGNNSSLVGWRLWSGNEVLLPNATATFSTQGLPSTNLIMIYYQMSDENFYYTYIF